MMRQKGFTLIEISVVLVIVGIIISVVGSILPSIISTSKIKRTNATLEKFDYSLQGYMIANNRLPCPDTDGNGRENLTAGAGSDCTAYTGTLPYIDIGVSSANDPFNNPVGYAVYGAAGVAEVDLTNTYADASDFLTNGLNAANNEIATAGGFVGTKVYTTFSDFNNVVDNATSTGQAYVLVSGGQRDINAPAGFYDHLNFSGNTQFSAPNKINTDSYDDSVLAQNPNFLAGKHFSGSGGGSGPSNTLENTNALCMDGNDNDGDTAIDCADSDCSATAHCVGQTNVTVASTPALPVGSIGATPSYTFLASGGSSAPQYYWSISNIPADLNGDLGVNYFTGALTGNYDACPGSYTLTIRAEDRNDGSNFDTQDFNLTINSGSLGLLPVPSGGVDYTVDTTIFSQVFTLTGGTAGNTQWALNWSGGDPGGLVLQANGDSAELVKNAGSNSGNYAFTISISDSECPANTFTSPVYNLEVTGSGAAPPIDSGLLGEWRFDESSWTIAPGDVKDTSGKDNHGTINGDVFPSAANPARKTIPGTCSYAEFDGSRDYIQVPNSSDFTFNGQITIAAWVRADRTTGSQMIAYQGYGSTDPFRSNFMRIINGRLYVGKQNPWTVARYNIPAADLGTWVHYTGLYNGTAWQIYKNGTLVAFTNTTAGAHTVDRDWFIGGYRNSHSLLGAVDNLRIYDRALSTAEITEVMNLNNTCQAQASVLPSCGLTPNNGIVMSTYNKNGANPSHPTDANTFDSMVTTYALPANLFGSGIQAQINGSGNPYGTDSNYLSLFDGYIEVPESGYYTFAVDGDDAIDIVLNGNTITGWYGGHGRRGSPQFPVTVGLESGFHELRFRHEEAGGGDNYYMYYQEPSDSSLGIAPASIFKYCP